MKHYSLFLLLVFISFKTNSSDFVYETNFVNETSFEPIPPTTDYQEGQARIRFFREMPCTLSVYPGQLPQTVCTLIRSFTSTLSTQDFNNTVLLEGPPGTGKTFLAEMIAKHTSAIFIKKDGSEFQTKFHGETAENIRKFFADADKKNKDGKKVVLFIDEVDSVGLSSDGLGFNQWMHAETKQLITLVQKYRQKPNVLIILATNDCAALDAALNSRSLRISMPLPSEGNCEKIITYHLQDYNSDELNPYVKELAKRVALNKLSARDIQDMIELAIQKADQAASHKVTDKLLNECFNSIIEMKKGQRTHA